MNTFFWTTATILAALDAGILSVQAQYNTQYVNGISIHGVGPAAHTHALRATLIFFRTADNYRALVAEDTALDALITAMDEATFAPYDELANALAELDDAYATGKLPAYQQTGRAAEYTAYLNS